MAQLKTEALSEVIKAAPPVGVIAATSQGMSLQDWVFIFTIAYIVLQAAWLVWRWWRAATTKGWTPHGVDD